MISRMRSRPAKASVIWVPIDAIEMSGDRLIAPSHELNFYGDEDGMKAGIGEYEALCKKAEIESFVLVELLPPLSSPDGLPSEKQITMGAIISGWADKKIECAPQLYQRSRQIVRPVQRQRGGLAFDQWRKAIGGRVPAG